MGYYTKWEGELNLSRQLTLDEYNTINDVLDNDVHIPQCPHGPAWFSVSLNKEGTQLQMPEDSSKTYYWQETLQFLIDNWLEPMGIKLNGKLKWYGEENGDLGKVSVVDSIITVTDIGAQVRALMNE